MQNPLMSVGNRRFPFCLERQHARWVPLPFIHFLRVESQAPFWQASEGGVVGSQLPVNHAIETQRWEGVGGGGADTNIQACESHQNPMCIKESRQELRSFSTLHTWSHTEKGTVCQDASSFFQEMGRDKPKECPKTH